MKFHLKYSSILCLLMAGNALLGQVTGDTTLQFHDILIEKNTNPVTTASEKVDNTLVDFAQKEGRRMSDILSDHSGVYLKNYGVGQLSSISINGSSAAQTTIQWNGIKLNSPTSGQVDLSLFDISGGDKLSLYTTSQNRTNGIIGLGGTVALNNELDLGDAKNIRSYNTLRIGSFGEKAISTSQVYGIKGFRGSTKLSFISADNDFRYVNYTKIGAPLTRQTNAATKQISFSQQLRYTFKKPYTIGANLWVTDADRQLPAVMAAPAGHEHQWDQSYRTMAYFDGQKSGFKFSFKTAYIYDKLKYISPDARIDSRSITGAFRNVFMMSYDIKKFFLHGELHYDRESARSSGFTTPRTRDISGLDISAHYYGVVNAGISVHGQLLGTKALPISASAFIGITRIIRKDQIQITLNGERNYRLPGLNDLFWNEGGNPELKPEKAWKVSLHTVYRHSYWLTLMADGFYNYTTDWIQWSPASGSAFWTAQNLKRVLSRGTTLSMQMQNKKDLKNMGFIISGLVSYSYTNTISLDAISANDNSKGKQLIYVPLHNFTASVQLSYRHFYIRSMHSYTGDRFTSTDNSQVLKPYYLTNLEVGKDFYFSAQQIGLAFRINNITNTQYQMVTQRAMPGRGFEGTIRINLSR